MYTLRPFQARDHAAVTRLHLAAFKEIGESKATLEKFLTLPKATIIVVQSKKTHRVVGYYGFTAKRKAYYGNWMSVAKSYRGNGLGQIIVTDFLKRARKNKVREVLLSTRNRFKPAMICYLNCGFQINRTYKAKDGDTMIEFVWRDL